jgi:hypothetical protein
MRKHETKAYCCIGYVLAILLLTLALSGCGERAEIALLENVILEPESYSGKMIDVQGAAVIQHERYFICANAAAVDSQDTKCVWINPNHELDGLDHIGLLVFEKKLVSMVGRFSTERKGHLSHYVGEITPISVKIIGTHAAGDIPYPVKGREES